MQTVNSLKTRMIWAGSWLVEDPRRAQALVLALMTLAIAIAAVSGLTATGMFLAGNAPGGSGGSG